MDSTLEPGPSYYGFVGSTYDALILFEACINGQIKCVPRRPQEQEREHVIQSGRVFIYEENKSRIKRWTDGISWSPSRILGNFLIYRQLQKAFGPGEKKRALKKPRISVHGVTKLNSRNNVIGSEKDLFQIADSGPAKGGNYGRAKAKRLERKSALVGSLTDTYEFLEEGLVKKTISVIYRGATHHLVSYYTISDAINEELMVPSKDPELAGIHPRASLITSQNFRNPVEDVNPMGLSVNPRNIYEMYRPTCLLSQIAKMPHSDLSNVNSMTAGKAYTISHMRSLNSSALEYGSSASNSTNRYHTRQISARGIYSALHRSEKCHEDEKLQFEMMASPRINYSCAMRIAKTIEEEATIRDTWGLMEFSAVGGSETDLTLCHSRNPFYKPPQDIIPTIESIEAQENLQGLVQANFGAGREYTQKKHFMAHSNEIKLWHRGNGSAGHGHCQSL